MGLTLCVLGRLDFVGLSHLDLEPLMQTVQDRARGNASVGDREAVKGASYTLASVAVCFRRSLTF